jgi:uncharacterized protein YbaR (Trm112 family)
MIASELLALLRCPETLQSLTIAPAELVAKLEADRLAGRLLNRAGELVGEPIEGGLVRDDGTLFYPIRGGIPVLIAAEGVALPLAVAAP